MLYLTTAGTKEEEEEVKEKRVGGWVAASCNCLVFSRMERTSDECAITGIGGEMYVSFASILISSQREG